MKSQNSIMPENYEEFISLTLGTRNSKNQECSQEIGNASGSRYALQDKQEQSAWDNSW